jgi:hypothetical protein
MPNFITYNPKGKLDPPSILLCKKLWREMRVLDEKLSFKKLTVQKAFRLVLDEKNKTWARKIEADEEQPWVDDMTSRLRAQARHIMQTSVKSPHRPWLKALWQQGVDDLLSAPAAAARTDSGESAANEGEEESEEESPKEHDPPESLHGDDEDDKDSDNETLANLAGKNANKKPAASASTEEYYYGYDFDTKSAWRAPAERPTEKQYSTESKLPPKAKPDDSVLFKFEDTWIPIAALKCSTFEVQQRVKYEGSRGPLWVGLMRKTKERITISKKKDRRPLLIMADSKGQILQVALSSFAASPQQALEPALDFMMEIGEKYTAGKILKEDLVKHRDDRLVQLFSAQVVMKRPAAAASKHSEAAMQPACSAPAPRTPQSASSGSAATRAAPTTPPSKKAKSSMAFTVAPPPIPTGEWLDMPWDEMP